MRNRRLLAAALLCCAVGVAGFEWVKAETPSPSPSLVRAETPPPGSSFHDRLAAAKSVKVMTSIAGVELGMSLNRVRAALDKLRDPAQPVKEETAEPNERDKAEHKVLWQLAKTDFASVFVKADEKKRLIYVAGFLRPGKEIPFDKIGEIKKAPIQDDRVVAWDVVRPEHPLLRVVARGAEHKASSITIFLVKRPESGSRDE